MSPVKSSQLTTVKYMGDVPCWTVVPAADWQPGEEKQLAPDEVETLRTNENFKVVDTSPSAPAPPVTLE